MYLLIGYYKIYVFRVFDKLLANERLVAPKKPALDAAGLVLILATQSPGCIDLIG